MNNIIIAVAITAISFLCGAHTYNNPQLEETNNYKKELIHLYEAHMVNVETLLDQVCEDWESFPDVTGETDAYYNYRKSYQAIQKKYEEEQ